MRIPSFTLLISFALAPALCAAQPTTVPTDLPKGHRLFLERGLQIHALCFPDCNLSIKSLKDAHFTAITWTRTSNWKLLVPPPLPFYWCNWISESVTSPATLPAADQPYASQIDALQLSDEEDLNQPAKRATAAKWFEAARPNFPSTILYTNQYGGQLTNENLEKYVNECHPDMLSFDSYPMLLHEPDNWRGFFGDCMRYRKFALAHNLPANCWIQTFHGEDRYRDPSEPEMRLNVFGPLTYGFKMLSAFTYNAGSSSLFKGPGDHNPTPAYHWLAQINQQILHLSPALVRLKSTDVRVLPGQHIDSTPTTSPSTNSTIGIRHSALPNPLPWDNQPWAYDKSLSQLRGITVTNTGDTNDHLPGDVLLGFFQPLAPSLTTPDHAHDTYLMITNALVSRTATTHACRQKITLNLVLPKDALTLLHLNPTTGKVEPLPLQKVPNNESRYLCSVELDGGSADLIKLSPGEDFIGVPSPTP